MMSSAGKLALLLFALLGGCTSTRDTFWVHDGLEPAGNIVIRASNPVAHILAVEVREVLAPVPDGAVIISEAEVEAYTITDLPTRLANIPAGVGMIALTPLALPVGIGLAAAGVDDIGHCQTYLLPVVTLIMGAAHAVPVADLEGAYVFSADEDAVEHRRTGQIRETSHRCKGGKLLPAGPVKPGEFPPLPMPMLPGGEPVVVELSAERISIPRYGIEVRILPADGKASPVRETDIHGYASFQFDRDTYPSRGFDVEVTVDGETHRLQAKSAAEPYSNPEVIHRD